MAYHSGSHFSPKDTTKLRQMLEFSEPNMEQLLVGCLLVFSLIPFLYFLFFWNERVRVCVCVSSAFQGKQMRIIVETEP